MNKHLLLILLGFGLIGCAIPKDTRNYGVGCGDDSCVHASHFVETLNDPDLKIVTDYKKVSYPKAEAINLETGERFHYGAVKHYGDCFGGSDYDISKCPSEAVLEHCKNKYNSQCVLSRFDDFLYYRDLNDYKQKSLLASKGVSAKTSSSKKRSDNKKDSKPSWFEQFASGFVEGLAEEVVGEVVEQTLGLDCEEDIKVTSKQKDIVPGAPEYGSKVTTTVKQKKCP